MAKKIIYNSEEYQGELQNQLDTVLGARLKSFKATSVDNVVFKEDLESGKDSTSGPFIVDADSDITTTFGDLNLTSEQKTKIATNILTQYKDKESITTDTGEGDLDSDSSNSSGYSKVMNAIEGIGSAIVDGSNAVISWASSELGDFINVLDTYGDSGNSIGGTISSILKIVKDNMQDYQDGVSETSFGSHQEETWQGSTKSFLNYFKAANAKVSADSRKVNFLSSTPLDSGASREALYGSMMLGCPFLFNKTADPGNRTIINTFVKDGRFLSLTPGMPKYNGTSYTAATANSYLNQTTTPEAMLKYLQKNGLDQDFTNKDKRYYTFETKYEEYFAYLETMLNAIWVKLGLAKNGETFNLFTFFDLKASDSNGGINAENYKSLLAQYNSSIGFFVNIASAVSESVDSSQTSFGSELESEANQMSDNYQKINYITGMGTGSGAKNLSRKIGIASTSISGVLQKLKDVFGNTRNAYEAMTNAHGTIAKGAAIAKLLITPALDISNFNNTEDLGAVMQSFATSNGMKVKYPELWSDTTYSKNVNFNFSFVSPYGDPLSIFKYVYVPFLSLLCFALPRQAAENGYVSPFFVRADVPGLFTSDLALITSMSWTKGGGNALWTKDGLPRAIDVSITISDLYQYLSMTKRVSCLSANPSYAVFLDSLTGMMALNDSTSSDNELNEYFKEMIDRVNGKGTGPSLWNKFNKTKSAEAKRISDATRNNKVGFSIRDYSIPWMHNSSLY